MGLDGLGIEGHMELIEGIPFGLVLCRLNGEQVTVKALADDRLLVRLCERSEVRTLDMQFLRFREASWEKVVPKQWRKLALRETDCGFELLLEVKDELYRQSVRRVLREYADYVRGKLEGDDDALAEYLTGCPDEAVSAASLDEQKAYWFSGARGKPPAGKWSLALSLDRPDVYDRFLQMPFPSFQADFFCRNHIAAHGLATHRASRIYLGNAFCAQLCPEELDLLLDRAREQRLSVTLVLPPIRERRRCWALEMLKCAAQGGADEVEVNDLGMLGLMQGSGITPILGIHLNKRRKDPRMPWKLGVTRDGALPKCNALNDPLYQSWLMARGVRRYEYEACGDLVRVAPGQHSLHLPFFQTNTSHDCPLAARCEGSDPGAARSDVGCAQLCRTHVLIYPNWMCLTGRYNSLFGVNGNILREETELAKWLGQGIDRLVMEML